MSNGALARVKAKLAGEKFFDIGFDCRHGHGTIRRTISGGCPGCDSRPVRTEEWKINNRHAKWLKYNQDAEHRQKLVDRVQTYRDDNTEYLRDKERDRAKERYQVNPTPYCIRGKVRSKRLRKATPKGLTARQFKSIDSVYDEAARLTEATSIPHEVDHIVPLNGENVCGLHVPWNLRVITQQANRAKRNSMPAKELQVCLEAPGYRQLAPGLWKPTKPTTISCEGLR